ncbi:flagellar motor protein MotB [Legionella spiritensis]|uniref:flagellar motor protein MotB n=1 Tax=Legionella spiritensis TaxID=452 RepID=UPI000F6B815E|nr:flagellar motor protein MotB [Legionella spiritensis]VEG90659.1 flagellar motor protein MotB [Legionella spiritensis]
MRKRNKKEENHEDAHRWVVSYADFITLLFAFFVVMYAISSVNVSKYKAMAQGMHSAFNSSDGKQAPVEDIGDANGQSAGEIKGSENEPFEALSKALADLQDPDIHIQKEQGWVELDIKAGALFDSGSADLKPSAIIKMMKVAEVLKEVPFPIALEGYTDNVPISTPKFPSNWELSTGRAAAMARVLTMYGVDPGKITVTGYGAQYPVADNATEEGRAKNRRVNLIISKDKMVPRLLNPAISIEKHKTKAALQTGEGASALPENSRIEPIKKEVP